jgi:hypothetical protein
MSKYTGCCPSCGNHYKIGVAECYFCGANLASAEVAPSTLSDEQLRAKLKSSRGKSRLYMLGMLLCLPFALVTAEAVAIPVGLLFLAGAFVLLLLFSGQAGRGKKLLAANVTRAALEGLFTVEEYRPHQHIHSASISAADLVKDWNRISGSDFVRGQYKGHNIQFSDVKLEKETEYTDDDGDTRTRTELRFKGQWLVLELEKELPSPVLLRERKGLLKGRAKSDVETENAAFNEKYLILTQDGHTAFYVLTPHFMEFLMRADEKVHGRSYFAFGGNTVDIALDTHRDLFEAGMKSAAKDLDALRARQREEARFLTDILDELLQNEYLFGRNA